MTRRMTLVVLALVGSMVLVVTVSPPDSGVRDRAQATATPGPPAARLSDPDAFDVSKTLSAAAGAEQQTVAAELGDRVEIVVEGPELDVVLLGDLGAEGLEAGFPARFELLADTPGRYPLVLMNAERRIGTLEVR
jgi:hypothetical protein